VFWVSGKTQKAADENASHMAAVVVTDEGHYHEVYR
jgi:hypothetical protein